MSDQFIARLNDTLAEFNLSFAEYAILHLIHYEPRDFEEAPGYARGLLNALSFPQLPTGIECQAAIESLCKRGLTTIVDSAGQDRIVQFIRRLECLGPTEGIPFLGQLDFTLAGADLWRNLLNATHTDREPDYFWHSCSCIIRRRNATIVLSCVAHEARLESYEVVPISEPEPIGPWRMQWWREIPHGFRIRCLPYRRG